MPIFEGIVGHSLLRAVMLADLRLARGMAVACLSAALLGLGGCGGVEFEGKVFDYAGLSGERKEEDVKMSERAPLVIPPNPNHLPPPGSGPATPAAWPTNPEVAARQAEESKVEEEQKTAATEDPLNPYVGKPTLLDKLFGSDKEKPPAVAAVPEPDPSAAIPPVNSSASQGAPQRNAYKPPTEGPSAQAEKDEEAQNPSSYDAINSGTYRGL